MKEAAFMAHYAVVYEDTIYHVWTPCPGEPRANSMWASLVAQTAKHLPAMQETRVQVLGQEDPLEKEMATHPSILAWEIP